MWPSAGSTPPTANVLFLILFSPDSIDSFVFLGQTDPQPAGQVGTYRKGMASDPGIIKEHCQILWL